MDITAADDNEQKINIDMCPIMNGYGIKGVFFFRKRFLVKPASEVVLRNLESAGRGTVSRSCNSEIRHPQTSNSEIRNSETRNSQTRNSLTRNSQTRNSQTRNSQTRNSQTRNSQTRNSQTRNSRCSQRSGNVFCGGGGI